VPIVLATIPLTAGHPDGGLAFDVVFVVVLVSLAVQSSTVGLLAERLHFESERGGATVEPAVLDSLVTDLVELQLDPSSRLVGQRLRDAAPPGGSRIALLVRLGETFVPDGDLVFKPDDVLLLAASAQVGEQDLRAWADR
jgi:cell volume regulation protein A